MLERNGNAGGGGGGGGGRGGCRAWLHRLGRGEWRWFGRILGLVRWLIAGIFLTYSPTWIKTW